MLDTEWIKAKEAEARPFSMVVLHGLGDSMEGYRWLPDGLRLPWLNYLLVNAPDPYFGGFSWYDYQGDAATGVNRSRRLLIELLEDHRRSGADFRRTFFFGFSQGCLMTLEIGMRFPSRFAGMIGISGYVLSPEELLEAASPEARAQRFLVTHGTQDPLIPIDFARAQMRRLKAAGMAIEWHEFLKGHTIAGEEELGTIRAFILARRAKIEASAPPSSCPPASG